MAIIKIKRGSVLNIPTLLEGELALTTDTKKVFIGTDVGNSQLGDMLISLYDTDGDGIVNNAALLDGVNKAFLLGRSNHTGTQAATTIVEDSNHLFTTSAEKITWNGKADRISSPADNIILLCDTIGNPKLSTKLFNDNGTSVNDILSAAKIIELIDAATGGGISKSRINVTLSTDQPIPDKVWTKLQFDNELIDSLSEFDSTTNYRFTAQNSGRYNISVILDIEYDNNGYRSMRLYVNGVPSTIQSQVDPNKVGGIPSYQHLSVDIELSQNDYIEIFAYQDSRGPLNALASVTTMTITRII